MRSSAKTMTTTSEVLHCIGLDPVTMPHNMCVCIVSPVQHGGLFWAFFSSFLRGIVSQLCIIVGMGELFFDLHF